MMSFIVASVSSAEVSASALRRQKKLDKQKQRFTYYLVWLSKFFFLITGLRLEQLFDWCEAFCSISIRDFFIICF